MSIIRTIILLFICSACTKTFYQPSREQYFVPKEGESPYPHEVRFESKDHTKLYGWYFKSELKEPSRGLVLQFHGNAENLSSHFSSLIWVVKEGYDLFAFDYRGYGVSEGDPYPYGVYLDSLAAMEKAMELTSNKSRSIIIYAQSLGGPIALRALADMKDAQSVRSVVLESSFYSYKSVAAKSLQKFWVTWPFQWLGYILISDHYGILDSDQKLPNIPYLVLHADEDPVVPIDQGEDLFEHLPEPKYFLEVHSDRHIGLPNLEKGKLRPVIIRFFEKGDIER